MAETNVQTALPLSKQLYAQSESPVQTMMLHIKWPWHLYESVLITEASLAELSKTDILLSCLPEGMGRKSKVGDLWGGEKKPSSPRLA